jgi:hemolysin III
MAVVQTIKEEIANAITHGIPAVLSIFGTLLLVQQAQAFGNTKLLVSFMVYGMGIFFLFTASTLYHSFQQENIKTKLRVFDHIGIYLMIAGTYTPFTLVTIQNVWGLVLFIAVWSIALFGVIFKIFFTGKYPKISLASYLTMGWLVVLGAKPMFDFVATNGLWLILAGGISFTIGTFFYRWHKLPYHHAIWHIFVFIGGLCHYFAVLHYTLPNTK